MFDTHTHLLPNMDDGSQSMETSLLALRQMAEGGIKSVFCTTHYMRGLYQFTHEDYMARFHELEAEVKHQNIPITLYPGAEVYLYYGVTEDIKKNKLTMADSSYVLIETDLNGFPTDMQKNVFDLLRSGYRPILAHAERYVSVMMKTHEAKEMINRSVYIQISAPSVIGGYGEKVKRTVWKMLNKGWVHFMGSDHHARNDYEAFFKAREKIVEHIDENMARILTSQHPRSILRDEKVDFSYVMIQRPPKRKFHRRLFRSLGL